MPYAGLYYAMKKTTMGMQPKTMEKIQHLPNICFHCLKCILLSSIAFLLSLLLLTKRRLVTPTWLRWSCCKWIQARQQRKGITKILGFNLMWTVEHMTISCFLMRLWAFWHGRNIGHEMRAQNSDDGKHVMNRHCANCAPLKASARQKSRNICRSRIHITYTKLPVSIPVGVPSFKPLENH